MQCPSCRFENMPGLVACGRCGTSLNLATAEIDVNPPRASRRAKRLRPLVPRTAIYTARDTVTELRRIALGQLDEARVPLPEAPLLGRLIVPGWGHSYLGLPLRGRIFLSVYLLLMALGLLFWSTDVGAIALGLAMSVHVSSVLDVLVRQGTMRFPRMMLTSAIIFLVLGVVVYFPAYYVGSHVAAPIHFVENAAPFARYDTVLVNRWAFWWNGPRRGDVVAFRPAWNTRTDADYGIPHARVVIEETVLIDRVLGQPGDHVVWENGRLAVNDVPVSWTSLVPHKLPRRLDVKVPAGRYLVFPTTSRGTPLLSESDWPLIGLIAASDIEGGAFLRNSPLSRFWFIR